MKTEWECIDLNCTHWDGDTCMLGFCEPDTLTFDVDMGNKTPCNETERQETVAVYGQLWQINGMN